MSIGDWDYTGLEGVNWYLGKLNSDRAPDGYGRMQTFQTVYEGEFQNGLRHGKGRIIYWNGYFYAGEWQDDQYHGEGVFGHPSLPQEYKKGPWEYGSMVGKPIDDEARLQIVNKRQEMNDKNLLKMEKYKKQMKKMEEIEDTIF